MITFKNLDINNITIDESFIKKIYWHEDRTGVSLELDWCGQENIYQRYQLNKDNHIACLVFDGVRNLTMNLDYNEFYSGWPEISELEIQGLDNEYFLVIFLFLNNPKGKIEFKCIDCEFKILN